MLKLVIGNDESYFFDGSKIVDAISKAVIRQEMKKAEKEISVIDLFTGVGGYSGEHEIYHLLMEEILNREYDEYEYAFYHRLQLERERWEQIRERLRALRRLKTARVSQMIRTAWMNRNHTAGRSNTGAVTDPMLLSIPTPPTSEAANCSLRCGGNMIAYI